MSEMDPEETSSKKRLPKGASFVARWVWEKIKFARLEGRVSQAAITMATATAVAASVVVVSETVFEDAAAPIDTSVLADRVQSLEIESDAVREATLDLAGDLATLTRRLSNPDGLTPDDLEQAVREVRESVASVDALARSASDAASETASALGVLDTSHGQLTSRVDTLGAAAEYASEALDATRSDLDAAATLASTAATTASEAAVTASDARDIALEAIGDASEAATLANQVAAAIAEVRDEVSALADDLAGTVAEVDAIAERVEALAAEIAANTQADAEQATYLPVLLTSRGTTQGSAERDLGVADIPAAGRYLAELSAFMVGPRCGVELIVDDNEIHTAQLDHVGKPHTVIGRGITELSGPVNVQAVVHGNGCEVSAVTVEFQRIE